jgi:hypothetical protein
MENETYGDAVETNAKMNEEALRRARARNTDSEPPAPISGITPEPVVATDGDPYSTAEYAPAVPPQGPLNWGGGIYETTPLTYAPEHFGQPLASVPDCSQGQLSGVDAICGFQDRGRR